MNLIREKYIQLCVLSFAITSGYGLIQTLFPRLPARAVGVVVGNSFNARLLGLVIMVIGLAYLLALLFEEARVPLLILATLEKSLAVLYVLVAYLAGQVGTLALGMIVVDGAIAVFGVMAILMPRDTAS